MQLYLARTTSVYGHRYSFYVILHNEILNSEFVRICQVITMGFVVKNVEKYVNQLLGLPSPNGVMKKRK